MMTSRDVSSLVQHTLNIENDWELGLNELKNTDYMEKSSSKSYLELNSLQKSQWTHVSISPWGGARGLERLIQLKYNVQKCQIIFTSELNAAKNTDFKEKMLQVKVVYN